MRGARGFGEHPPSESARSRVRGSRPSMKSLRKDH